jgi:hypothetical protein
METDTARQGPYVKQFSVFLINRAGALLSVVRLLEDASVLVLGLSLQDSVDVTVARLIVSDPDTVETIFIERGIPFGVSDILVVQLRDGAKGLSQALTAFLQAETNIHFAYPLLTRPGGFAALALHLEDIEFGAAVMEAEGFHILRQHDISR